MDRVSSAALAGWVASLPHTCAMAATRPMLPPGQHTAVPPEKITRALWPDAPPLATTLAHFTYGAAMGAVYGAAVRRPDWRSGMAFGLGVWAVSYLGWLPAAGLHRPATRQPPGRLAMMVAAHLAWGSSLGALAAIWGTSGKRAGSPDDDKLQRERPHGHRTRDRTPQ